jgi:hypothetical protein
MSRREYKPNRRKLEFQTGVSDRTGDQAQKLNLAYTPHQSKGCSR